MIIDFPINEKPLERKEKVLDATLLRLDLPAAIEKIRNEIAWKTGSRDIMGLYRNPSMKIELIALHTGAKTTPHLTEGVTSLHVIEGVIKLRTGNETIVLNKGQILTLHANIMFEARAMEEAYFLLTVALDKFDNTI